MPSPSTPVDRAPVIEINPKTATVTWFPIGEDSSGGSVPWFPSIGVLDYARARPVSPDRAQSGPGTVAAPAPAYGEPLIVGTDLAAVYWRSHNLLCTAPIRSGRVNFAAAETVDWATAGEEMVLIEHNLAQCCPQRTLDPPLQVLRTDATGRLSFAFVVAADDGIPVIGPSSHHEQPWVPAQELETAQGVGLAGTMALWSSALRIGDQAGSWRLLPGRQALAELDAAGFTVTGPAARRPGLVAALADPGQWPTGWYGWTRALALARYERCFYGGDLRYDQHKPGSRRVAVRGDGRNLRDRLGMQGPADVETLPPEQHVYVEAGWIGGAIATPVPAGRVALCEPTLLDGPLPRRNDDPRWQAECRRCGVVMSSAAVGESWRPYVHELAAHIPGRGPAGLWCPAHPETGRRRPHAPTCRVVPPPDSAVTGLLGDVVET